MFAVPSREGSGAMVRVLTGGIRGLSGALPRGRRTLGPLCLAVAAAWAAWTFNSLLSIAKNKRRGDLVTGRLFFSRTVYPLPCRQWAVRARTALLQDQIPVDDPAVRQPSFVVGLLSRISLRLV